MNREDADNQWIFERCREVQRSPNGHLDLWAREHYKSTIITFALTIQDILNNPELTFGIFSHTRGIAKGFLWQIKREFEENAFLKMLFPDILWEHPKSQAPVWSLDTGIVVKRKSNPKEATIEAWGLVDGQPTSRHFTRMIYDDVVTLESVSTPEQIKKTTEAWEISRNLGAKGGVSRYIGTRYHYNDSYAEMMKRKVVEPRIHTATDDGTESGEPVLMDAATLAVKRREMGPYVYNCQMNQNPRADETQGFKEEWVRFYGSHNDGADMNVYILVDPANDKKKRSDFTAVWVIGCGPDGKFYALDIYRDRLSLTQRTELVFKLHRKWEPLGVYYEKYGKDTDIDHIKTVMDDRTYHFDITPVGGPMAKFDRIRKLIPKFEQSLIYLPQTCYHTNHEGVTEDVVQVFIDEEYKAFPLAAHDDLLDSLARITDDDVHFEWPDQGKSRAKLFAALKVEA